MTLSPLLPLDTQVLAERCLGRAVRLFFSRQGQKTAGDAQKSYALTGRLVASKSGWVLLSVPNALGRGAFDALGEVGAELPGGPSGYNAHISVIRPEELAELGGVDKISERGHSFHYTLGALREVRPAGWDEMSRVWFIEVRSPELEKLRKSYGLSALPDEGSKPFHITVAVRKKKVTQPGGVVKESSPFHDSRGKAWHMYEHEHEECPAGECCPHCEARLERDPDSGCCNSCGKAWPEGEAKEGRDGHLPGGGHGGARAGLPGQHAWFPAHLGAPLGGAGPVPAQDLAPALAFLRPPPWGKLSA
jgi:hypothetical protein